MHEPEMPDPSDGDEFAYVEAWEGRIRDDDEPEDEVEPTAPLAPVESKDEV